MTTPPTLGDLFVQSQKRADARKKELGGIRISRKEARFNGVEFTSVAPKTPKTLAEYNRRRAIRVKAKRAAERNKPLIVPPPDRHELSRMVQPVITRRPGEEIA